MKCPNDDTTLAMTDRQGIEIDYCPTCRGVWLDRGELDKLISVSSNHRSGSEQPRYEERPQSHSNNQNPQYHKKHKRESFLGDLFDF